MASVGGCLPSKKLLDDLYSRFVLNGPEKDKQSFERIMFLVESAYWYYEDDVVEKDQTLKSLSLREFTRLLFNNCDVLRPYVASMDEIFRDFYAYRSRIPVAGAIILDETYERCVLVKGWKSSSSWSFPRGKKNKNEKDDDCAIREVFEETGFDVSKRLKKEEYIELTFEGEKRVRLYIVTGVKDDTAFAPQTKKEISQIIWCRLDGLDSGFAGLKLYKVAPFLASLKSWISKHPSPVARKPDTPLKPPLCVWTAKTTTSTTTTERSCKINSWRPDKPLKPPLCVSTAKKTKQLHNNNGKKLQYKTVETISEVQHVSNLSGHGNLFLSRVSHGRYWEL